MKTAIERAILARYPNAQVLVDFELRDDGNGQEPYVSAWRLPGSPPTPAEVPTLAAQYDAAQAQAQADAQALRQRIRTLLQSAVGKSIDPQAANALTAAERNAINAARWFMEGIINKDGLIRPLSEWFEL
jgi:hypothetical protein